MQNSSVLSGRRIGRRSFLAAIAVAAVSFTSACGGDSAAGESTSGGTATLGWSIPTPSSWDPALSNSGIDVTVLSLVYSTLTRLGPSGQAGPGLASAWTFAEDGLTLTLTLRPRLTFSDQAAVDAQAVKLGLEHTRDQPNSLVGTALKTITSIDTPTPTQVVLHLSRPDYALPLVFGGRAGMIVSPTAIKGNVKSLATKPVGAGPFTLTSYVPDGQAELRRNPAYWDATNIHVPAVTLKFLSDPAAIVSSLRSNEIQLATYIPPTQVNALRSSGLAVEEFRSQQVSNLVINPKIKPFDNPKIVEALRHAVNRQELLKTLAGGHGEVVYQPFPKGVAANNPALDSLYPYDPKRAKALLAEAGYDGTPIKISYFTSPGGVDRQVESELLQAQFQAVGFKVQLEELPFAQVSQRVYVKHEIGLLTSGFFGRESPAQQLAALANPYESYAPDKLTAALQNVARFPITDPGYAPALQAATQVAVREGSDISLFTTPWLLAHSKKLTGLSGYLTSPRLEGVRLGD